MKVETFVFNGIIFRRYPQSKNWADRNYFRRGRKYLHREMWRSAHGDIPSGHDVHHKDGNTSNNIVDNLECLPSNDHQSNHEYTKSEAYKSARRAILDQHRGKAKDWHASDEGREWHSKNGKWVWEVKKPRHIVCAYCKKSFETRDTRRGARYCSNNCKQQARRVSGVDNKYILCAWCSTMFNVNKYSKTKCCSNSCAAYLRNSNRKQS